MDRSLPRSAYVHVPFCRHRCGYCNFTVLAGRDDLIERFLSTLATELSASHSPAPVDTLFIGGGTPTHLPTRQLSRLLEIVVAAFPPEPCAEFSVEANPADVSREKMELLARFGVNRCSLGVQSFDPVKLSVLERDHRRPEISRAFELARQFMPSVSLDLIFGAPGETAAGWLRDLELAVDTGCTHLSTYGLTFEKGTSFWSRRHRDELQAVEEEVERRMYVQAIDRLTAAGFEHYEVSNFCRPGFACRHNLVYWQGGEYFAAGPGASRHVDGERSTNHRSTTAWMRKIQSGTSAVWESERLSAEDKARERLVFGLRMIAGIDKAEFSERTGFDVEELGGTSLANFLQFGLLEEAGGRLRLTRQGLLISDSMWPSLLCNSPPLIRFPQEQSG